MTVKGCVNPGIGTPEEVEKILDAGLVEHLHSIVVPSTSHFGRSWCVVVPDLGLRWMCGFQDRVTHLCVLHDRGLKPLECVLPQRRLSCCPETKRRGRVRSNRNVC